MTWRARRSVLTLHKQARRPRSYPPAPTPPPTIADKIAAAVSRVKR